MYDSKKTADIIKYLLKEKNILIRDMLKACDLSVNAINTISDKKGLSSFSLAKIADFLDCSVDYLLGRTETSITKDFKAKALPSDKLFFIDEKFEPVVNNATKRMKKELINFINTGIVDHITIGGALEPVYTICTDSNKWIDFFQSDFGAIIFLTEEAAEVALKNMEGANGL